MSPSPVFEFCTLASGSRGNAIYLRAGSTTILVDAGLSGRDIQRRMAARDLDPTALTAILVTHEHRDHIHGVGVLARRFGLPVYMSPETRRHAHGMVGPVPDVQQFYSGCDFTIGELAIRSFSTSHDASDPSGFVFSSGGRRLGLATDLGVATTLVRSHLADCHALILEANHDPQMLMDGPYPWPLKQRIQSRMGHLSNTDAGRLLADIQHPDLMHVALAHLSETNNHPDTAAETVLALTGPPAFSLTVAEQHRPGSMIRLNTQADPPIH